MKYVPNCLSISRIILALSILMVEPLSTTFFIIYFICGATDVLDGFIARKFGLASELGSKLDSTADITLMTVMFVALFPMLKLTPEFKFWLTLTIGIRLLSILVVIIKYKTFVIIHTYGNKLTGTIVFMLLPIWMVLNQVGQFSIGVRLIALFATLTAIEELVINLTSKELDVNRISIFC